MDHNFINECQKMTTMCWYLYIGSNHFFYDDDVFSVNKTNGCKKIYIIHKPANSQALNVIWFGQIFSCFLVDTHLLL